LIESVEMRDATRNDFAMAQSLGVGGFPTLAAAQGPQLYLVTSGYVKDAVLDQRVAEIDRLTTQQTRSA
jgi:protein-disulfide isomerase-like protein with CxxC motif